jgi:hypothetical protein
MQGGQHPPDADRGSEFQHLPTLLGDPEGGPQKRLGGDGAQTHDECRVDEGQLGLEPWTASLDVGDLRCRMNPTLAPLGETKVLDRIRDVDIIRRYLSFPQCILQQPSGRTNKKGMP